MPKVFPGMDPYLETSILWRGFHNAYAYLLHVQLNQSLPEGFLATNEVRVYVSAPRQSLIPDVSIFATATVRQPGSRSSGSSGLAVAERIDAPEIIQGEEQEEAYVVVYDNRRGEMEVVAVIEILSPTNKNDRNEGHHLYRRKQRQTCEGGIHLLEIDLLRSGAYTVRVPEEVVRSQGDWDYLVTLFDATAPSAWIFWRVNLRNHLPALLLPLTHDVAPVRLDLQAALDRYFDENRVTAAIDYSAEPVPPLSPEDSQWATSLLREQGLRP
ncbi:MAG: DUF4058 family protein [Armatimonadaceae bacterium]